VQCRSNECTIRGLPNSCPACIVVTTNDFAYHMHNIEVAGQLATYCKRTSLTHRCLAHSFMALWRAVFPARNARWTLHKAGTITTSWWVEKLLISLTWQSAMEDARLAYSTNTNDYKCTALCVREAQRSAALLGGSTARALTCGFAATLQWGLYVNKCFWHWAVVICCLSLTLHKQICSWGIPKLSANYAANS